MQRWISARPLPDEVIPPPTPLLRADSRGSLIPVSKFWESYSRSLIAYHTTRLQDVGKQFKQPARAIPISGHGGAEGRGGGTEGGTNRTKRMPGEGSGATFTCGAIRHADEGRATGSGFFYLRRKRPLRAGRLNDGASARMRAPEGAQIAAEQHNNRRLTQHSPRRRACFRLMTSMDLVLSGLV